jgi:hypothetical protein
MRATYLTVLRSSILLAHRRKASLFDASSLARVIKALSRR